MMKKWLMMTMTGVLTLSLIGCASQGAPQQASGGGSDSEIAYYEEISDFSRYLTLGDYQNLKVTLPSTEVDDEAVDAQLQNYAANLPGVPVTDRTVSREGDQLLVDYSGRYKEDGTVFAGGTAEGQTILVGGPGYIDGFTEGMEGQTVGQPFEMEVTFPENYQAEELQGREVIFTVTIHSITAVPELTDDNIGELMNEYYGIPDIETVDDMREYIRSLMLEDAEASSMELLHDRVVEVAMEASTYLQDPPARIVERYEALIRSSVEQQAYMYQLYGYADMTTEYLLEQIMMMEGFTGTPEEFLHNAAVEQANSMMLFFAIASGEEGLMPSEEEIATNVSASLAQSGMTTEEEYEAASGYRLAPLVRESMVADNVVAYLEEHAEISYE